MGDYDKNRSQGCRTFFSFLLHLPYYKHSLSTRLICSDSVRFVKVLQFLQVGVIAQLVEHCTGITGHGFESCSSLNFFRLSFSQLAKLVAEVNFDPLLGCLLERINYYQSRENMD